MREYIRGGVSLTKIFAESIHLPSRKEDTGVYPLYPHKLGSEVAKRTIRSSGWHKEASNSFNSPSNIRLVCLDHAKAHISYWNTPIVAGRKCDIALPLSTTYEDGGVPLWLDAARIYSDTAGLGCLVRNYICPNIEELWVVAEIFGVAGNRKTLYDSYYHQLRSVQPCQVVTSEELAVFLTQETQRDIRTTFPLLRSIVVVVKPINSFSRGFYSYAQRTPAVQDYLKEVYPTQRKSIGEEPTLMRDIANKTGFGFVVCPLPSADILKFSLGDYKYDEIFLKAVKDKVIETYAEKPMLTKDTEDKVIQDTNDKCSLLDIIEDLEQAGYSKAAINTALFAYRYTDNEYLIEQIQLLPKEIVARYSDSLKGDISGNTLLFAHKQDRKARLFALARLAVEPPTEHLHSMIMCAYKESIFDLDTDYIAKYKEVYNALFDISTVAVIQSRLSRDGYTSAARIQKIREYLQGGTSEDIVPLINSMRFSLHSGNPSGFADFSTRDDVDLHYDSNHIVWQCASSIMASFDILYANTHSRGIKGAFAMSIPGYPEGVLCHNTADINKKGNDSLVRLSSPALECVRMLYSKTLCNATLPTDNSLRLCLESGAVSAECLGATQTLYFPRQAGRLISGVVECKQERFDDKASFMSAVRRWLQNRLMEVYTYYSRTGSLREASEAVRRATKSLSRAFIVTEYEDDGIRKLRVCSNMFAVKPHDIRVLSADAYTITDVMATHTDVDSVYTVTIVLNNECIVSNELSEDSIPEKKVIEARAELIYSEVARTLSEHGYRVSELMRTHSSISRVLGLDMTTHHIEVIGGVIDA